MLNEGFVISSYTYKECNVVTLYKTPVQPLITGTFKIHTFAPVAPKQRSPEVKTQQFIHTFKVSAFFADEEKSRSWSHDMAYLSTSHAFESSSYQEEVREEKYFIKHDVLHRS